MLVGIDIGGTKTHILVAAPNTEDVHIVVPTAEWQRSYLLGDSANAERLVALYAAHVGAWTGVPLAVGAHGCDTEAQCEAFRVQLERVHPGPVDVVNDAELLGPAAGTQDPVLAVIVGTGSIVVGTTSDGGKVTSGGHGWLLGDPGSAPALAREAVRAVLQARDEGLDREILAERFLAHCQAADETELSYLFASDLRITRWGSIAPLIFDCAKEGSPLAQAIIESAAATLAADVARIRRRGAQGSTVVMAGGVAVNQPLLLEAFKRHVAAGHPELNVKLLTIPPVWGALERAKHLTETSPTKMKESNEYHQPVG
ncbi:N-acetyl-D-glucosamine kinase [Arthrobacter sp. Hiyo4]|nr:N-acetyl-D-glucosamine kinase [Arthrobacter sp. Hiyo4]